LPAAFKGAAMSKLIFTHHAEEQMTDRAIGKPNVLGVLQAGERLERSDGSYRYTLGGITVVVKKQGSALVVITAWHEHNPRYFN